MTNEEIATKLATEAPKDARQACTAIALAYEWAKENRSQEQIDGIFSSPVMLLLFHRTATATKSKEEFIATLEKLVTK